MAFKWFKKDKTKPDKRNQGSSDSQDSLIEVDEKQSPAVEIQENASRLTTTAATFPEPATDAAPPRQKSGYFKRLKNRMSRSRKAFSGGFDKIFAGARKIDGEVLEELEELLITSDIGVQTTMDLIERLSKAKVSNPDEVKQKIKDEILSILGSQPAVMQDFKNTPHVILVVGVNGVGKTTTIGKIASSFSNSGKKVMIAAADTFRAAAVEQLTIWAERAGAEYVKHKENADPAAVAFDAVAAASARGCDIVLIDTAGRLHTKVNLMEELKKIKRIVAKQIKDAPHEILLVLDATTGQNALSQAKLFNDALKVTGLALTKLDGTAKGGIVISICSTLNIPLQYIGIGEQIEDLRPFDAELFVDALF
jgi:fused signal recognition particle receptor